MQVLRRRKHIKLSKSQELGEQYPCSLQFYTTPPFENITLQEFEQFALDRIQVLRIVENVGLKYNAKSNPNEYRCTLQDQLIKAGFKTFLVRPHVVEPTIEDLQCRRKDHISHFILRLAFCKTEELRKWFIAQELDLFRYRFTSLVRVDCNDFLKKNNLNFTPISEEEKDSILNELFYSSSFQALAKIKNIDYYKVPFVDALDLVNNRKVYLHKGYAYVPWMDLVTIVGSIFRSHLSHSLALASRSLPYLEEDHRLLRILGDLDRRYIGKDYSSGKSSNVGEVHPDMIDDLSKSSFPLCMRTMHHMLRTQHHLKHGGRMQYGLFLKGIGLSLEDALQFWKAEFTKNMAVDKFDKSYAYNIRHNYGKEGKRANYTPYSCVKIIQGTPGTGDTHGCPFKHSDSATLKKQLQSIGISHQGIQEIMELISKGAYQLACTKYFELTHKGAPQHEIQHPNQYFEDSRKILSGGTINTKININEIGITQMTTDSEASLTMSFEQSNQDVSMEFFPEDIFADEGMELNPEDIVNITP